MSDLWEDPYCYPGTSVLINRLDIRDTVKLEEAERKLTMLRLMDLVRNPMEGGFDLGHLCAIHKYIFQDLYEWAGEIRTVDIAKGNMFCRTQLIEPQAREIFAALRADDLLQGLGREAFAKKLAYYLSEINALHPFREGNGRCQREFVRSLASSCGYVLRFSRSDKGEMMQASRDSFMCDFAPMERLLLRCLQED